MPEKRVILLDISILATATRLRGIGRYVSELARGLVAIEEQWGELEIVFLERLGLDGSVTVSRELEPAIERLTARPADVRYRWAYPLRLFAGRAARKIGAKLLHLPAPGATPLALRGVPSLVTCHDLIPFRYPEHYAGIEDGFRWGRRALDRRRYGSARHVLAISRATSRELLRLLGLGRDRVSTVLSGIDSARWAAPTADGDAEQLRALDLLGRRFVACVGDADWRKNGDNMMQALAQLRRRDPSLQLVWAGKPSARSHDRARRAAAELHGVTRACHFVGYVPDPALGAIYRAALATLFVSRAEGFGYPVLEAMAAGSPVVASNTSSLPEVAADAALLVNPEEPAQIAAAVARLATDPRERSRLIQRGRERSEGLTLLSQARGTLEVYRRLCSGEIDKPREIA
jgi:glycosyltransferase involved in cell wall biosynthesis